MKRTFRRSIDELGEIFSFVRECLGSWDLRDADPYPIDLVLEELFSNMVKYGVGGEDSIEIGLERDSDPGCVRLALVDRGAQPWDVTQAREVDVDAPLEDRRIGGLGIHFVRKVSKEMNYSHKDGVTTLTVVIPLESESGSEGSEKAGI